jgi:hypothetical protein
LRSNQQTPFEHWIGRRFSAGSKFLVQPIVSFDRVALDESRPQPAPELPRIVWKQILVTDRSPLEFLQATIDYGGQHSAESPTDVSAGSPELRSSISPGGTLSRGPGSSRGGGSRVCAVLDVFGSTSG